VELAEIDVTRGAAVPGQARLILLTAATGPGIVIATGSFGPWAVLSPKADARL